MPPLPKQSRRRWFKPLAILFAIVALLDVGVWIRGQYLSEELSFTTHRKVNGTSRINRYFIFASCNGLHFAYDSMDDLYHFDNATFPSGWKYRRIPPSVDTFLRFPGIQTTSVTYPSWTHRIVRISHLTTSIAATTACLLFVRLCRRQRFAPGTCQKCGYDLRATPERCPECGAVPARA